jgi:uncharacterized protein
VGAKSAVRRGSYNFVLYAEMGSPGSTAGLARDLFDFVGEQENLSGEISCFVACCFEAPAGFDEEAFEGLLWEQLQRLHEQDRRHHGWDPAVSPDPEDPTFAFSFAGTAFFVGLHAASSRFARRFAWPTLVFNAHHQFDRLRKESRYDRFQEVIRDRERDLQGILTPNLADFGTRSEARQYFGRPVQGGWRCPFQGLQANDPHKDRRASGDEREG